MNNPFRYSDDNKRFHTWNYYLRHRYASKVCKVALNANFTCPNRDGTCGVGGCTFCTSMGSGEFAGDINADLMAQFYDGLGIMQNKWPDAKAFAYFQSYTNTYTSLKKIQEYVEPFMENDDVLGIAIATRADCLEDDKIAYLSSLSKKKEIWIELGLQSIYDETALHINRGHTFAVFEDCIRRLRNTNLKICVHLINSLPNETSQMMIESARIIGKLNIHAVKIHMLHIMEHTRMAKEYQRKPFSIMSKQEYIDTLIQQLEVLPSHIIIQRLTGDGDKQHLIAPNWTMDKRSILNEIDKEMASKNTWQGKLYS